MYARLHVFAWVQFIFNPVFNPNVNVAVPNMVQSYDQGSFSIFVFEHATFKGKNISEGIACSAPAVHLAG